jgi:hypothetical protein
MAIPVDTTGLRAIVIAGGGTWVGLQDTLNEDEPLVLFNSPTSKSTLALPLSLLSSDNIRGKIAGSDADFEKRTIPVRRSTLRNFSDRLEKLSTEISNILNGEKQ